MWADKIQLLVLLKDGEVLGTHQTLYDKGHRDKSAFAQRISQIQVPVQVV